MGKICYGCMSQKEQSPICEYCGYNENVDNLIHQLPCGTVLADRYVVGKVLGQGGLGITYLGWDRNLNVPVAVKEYYPGGTVNRDRSVSMSVFLTDRSKEESYRANRLRFLREAQTLAKLGNVPQIVRIMSFFEANNTAYIAMEYVSGMTLKNYVRMRGGKLSPEETMLVMQPVITALSYVHNEAMIHRDISPDNIKLLPNGGAKLLNFGTVREVTDEDVNRELTKSAESILKHGFAPIEQYQKQGSLGPWTDCYALCATAYYCLTGQTPPDAPARIVENLEPDWDSIPGLTPRQRGVLRKGMSIKAQERYMSMAYLWQELFSAEPWVESQPIPVSGFGGNSVNTAGEYRTVPVQNTQTGTGASAPAYTVPVQNTQTGSGAAAPAYTVPVQNTQTGSGAAAPVYTVPVQSTVSMETGNETTAPVQTAPNSRKKWIRIGAAAAAVLCVAAIGVGAWLFADDDSTTHEEPAGQEDSFNEGDSLVGDTAPESTEFYTYETVDPSLWRNNVLMADAPEGYSAEEVGEGTVLGSHYVRKNVITVTFLDSLADAPSTKWDVSQDQNGTVFAWVKKNGEFYDLYIGAEGGINGAVACERLFMGYLNLEEINFNGCFHTDDVESMSYMFGFCKRLNRLDLRQFNTGSVVKMGSMFYGCESMLEVNVSSFDTRNVKRMDNLFYNCRLLREVDLSSFLTGGVEDMGGMFYGCESLTELELSHFDTSSCTDMSFMFSSCKSLSSLDLSNFDTSLVENMQSMFQNCHMLRELDISSFNTSRVERMGWMFNWCKSLRKLDLRHFDTSNVVSVQAMFYGCKELTQLNITGWDLSKVEKYETFMDDGVTVNGKPWQELFR